MKKYIYIVVILLSSCTVDKISYNNASDKKEAELIVNKFYDHFKNGMYTEIYKQFSNGLGDTSTFLMWLSIEVAGVFNTTLSIDAFALTGAENMCL